MTDSEKELVKRLRLRREDKYCGHGEWTDVDDVDCYAAADAIERLSAQVEAFYGRMERVEFPSNIKRIMHTAAYAPLSEDDRAELFKFMTIQVERGAQKQQEADGWQSSWHEEVKMRIEAERERDEAIAERDSADGIWPEWAQQILERLRERGYQYDAEEEIQLPDDFISHVEGWLQATEDRYKARAEAAEAEVASLKKGRDNILVEAVRLREALTKIANAHPIFTEQELMQTARAALEAKHD